MRNTSKAVNSTAYKMKASAKCEDESAVSHSFTKKDIEYVSLFSFDTNQGLSENTLSFESEFYVLNGEAEITINGQHQHIVAGDILNIPANITHSLQAKEPFTMMFVKVCEELIERY